MSSAPKVNYAKHRNSSKGKTSQSSSISKQFQQKESLFSQCNPDNLKYINNELNKKKAKEAKNNQQKETKKSQSNSYFDEPYCNKIQNGKAQQNSRYQGTEEKDSDFKKDEQIIAKTQQEKQQQMLSGLRGQNKSSNRDYKHKFQAFENISADTNKKENKFLNFLQTYISQLHKNPKPHKISQNTLNLRNNKNSSLSPSMHEFYSKAITKENLQEQQFLSKKLTEEKKKNAFLQQQLQNFRQTETVDAERITNLQRKLEYVMTELTLIKSALRVDNQNISHPKQKRDNSSFSSYYKPQKSHQFQYMKAPESQSFYEQKKNHHLKDKKSMNLKQHHYSQAASLQQLQQQYLEFRKKGLPNLKFPFSNSLF